MRRISVPAPPPHPCPADRQAAVRWAQAVLANPEQYVILDTETTGRDDDDEVIQIGVIDLQGTVLLDSLVKPKHRRKIPEDATAIHGITMTMLKDAPAFDVLLPSLLAAVDGKTVLIYNEEFDLRLLWQTSTRNEASMLTFRSVCVMLQYAQYWGAFNARHGDYTWRKLPGASHGAVGDCQATLAVLHSMASTPAETPAAAAATRTAPAPAPPQAASQEKPNISGPVWMMVIGLILCITCVGAIIGIPLIVIGLVQYFKAIR